MFHSILQNLFSTGPRRGGEAQNLWQLFVPIQLFLHIATHDLVVDSLLLGVVTLVDDEQRDV